LLQHADEQVALLKLSCNQRRERPVGLETGAEQDAARFDPLDAQKALEEEWRHAQYGNRITHEWQHRGQALERVRLSRHRQVTRPSPRSHPKLG
jgi:hypothetical protein